MRILSPIIISVILFGCAGTKTWVVPADLQEGSAADMVKDAVDAGRLRDLMITAEEQLFDTDEMRFAEFLRAALASGKLSDDEVSTAQWMLHDVCELNAPGSKATDFEFDTPEQTGLSLHNYLPGNNLILIIYDPDCGSCKSVIGQLTAIGEQVNVLAVCVEASESRWTETRDSLPADWVKAFDRSGIISNDNYIIRSMPGVYLLDGERNVVLKHPKPEQLLEFLKI